tara:strand:+ start:13622 stop:13834 length:213 start_codon:yes stop_codon:yes gene_type:complete
MFAINITIPILKKNRPDSVIPTSLTTSKFMRKIKIIADILIKRTFIAGMNIIGSFINVKIELIIFYMKIF